MPKLFRVFDLDSEEVKKVSVKKRLELNLPNAARRLIRELKAKGYVVLESLGTNSGIPTSLIVGIEVSSSLAEQNLNDDFNSIAAKLELRWFKSGQYAEMSYT